MRLAASLRLSLYAVTAALLATGLAWLAARNAAPQLASPLMSLHGACAMVIGAVAGAIAALHAPAAWREARNRASGVALATLLTVAAATGWLLYYAGGESLRAAASLLHWVLGIGIPALLGAHIFLGRRTRRGAA